MRQAISLLVLADYMITAWQRIKIQISIHGWINRLHWRSTSGLAQVGNGPLALGRGRR
jgi:hypothetical protein